MMVKIQRLFVSREYSEFRDLVILLESSFVQITKGGTGIRQVQLAITQRELIIATFKISRKYTEDESDDSDIKLINILPLECVHISVYSKKHYKLKIRFCSGAVKYYELSERENCASLWLCWRDRIHFLNSDSTVSSVSETSIDNIDTLNTNDSKVVPKKSIMASGIDKSKNTEDTTKDALSCVYSLLDESSCIPNDGVPISKQAMNTLLGAVNEKTIKKPEPAFHSIPRFASGVEEQCNNRLSLGTFSYPRHKNTESTSEHCGNSRRVTSGTDDKKEPSMQTKSWNVESTRCKTHNPQFTQFLIDKLCFESEVNHIFRHSSLPSSELKQETDKPATKKESFTILTKHKKPPEDSCLRFAVQCKHKKKLTEFIPDPSYTEWLHERKFKSIDNDNYITELRQKLDNWKKKRDNMVFDNRQTNLLELAESAVVQWENEMIGKAIPKPKFIIPFATVQAGLIELQGRHSKLNRIRCARSEVNLFKEADTICILSSSKVSRGMLLHNVSLPNIHMDIKNKCKLRNTKICETSTKPKVTPSFDVVPTVAMWFLPLPLNISKEDFEGMKSTHYRNKIQHLQNLKNAKEVKKGACSVSPICANPLLKNKQKLSFKDSPKKCSKRKKGKKTKSSPKKNDTEIGEWVDFLLRSSMFVPMSTFNPIEIAKEMTLIDKELLLRLNRNNLRNFVVLPTDDYNPHLKLLVVWYNRIVHLTITQIINEKNASERAKIILMCIQIAKELLIIQNYNSAHAILSAMQSLAIGQLKTTWALVYYYYKHEYKFFYEMCIKCIHNSMFLAMTGHKAMQLAFPFIPFYGDLLGYLIGFSCAMDLKTVCQLNRRIPIMMCPGDYDKSNLERLAMKWRQDKSNPEYAKFKKRRISTLHKKTDLKTCTVSQSRKVILDIAVPPADIGKIMKRFGEAAMQYKFQSKKKIRNFLLYEPYHGNFEGYSQACELD